MAVSLRLARHGAKKRPFYRIVATDSRNPRNGRFIEHFGHYDPTTTPATIQIDQDRLDYWLKQGAQPSDTVARLIRTVARSTPAAE